jgi:hypothetical protein
MHHIMNNNIDFIIWYHIMTLYNELNIDFI